MKQELMNCEVLAMYDIREIQSFIFKTNKVKDMMGASRLVEDLLWKGLKKCLESTYENSEYILDWDTEEAILADKGTLRLDTKKEIRAQVLFIGGGNAYILYRTGEDARKVNRKLAVWLQKNSYSLQLVTAAVRRSESFQEDYHSLQEEMNLVKRRMNRTAFLGAFPVMEREKDTGLPVTAMIKEGSGEDKLCVSRETQLKRAALPNEQKRHIFDKLVDKKGEDSTLAVVHIDGNNMGNRILELLKRVQTYPDAVERMRQVSINIASGFQEAYETIKEKADAWENGREEGDTQEMEQNKESLQKIILAGDDLTFICTGKLALPLVEAFVNTLAQKRMYSEGTREDGFSVCAGIAYVYSHFPFSDAYQMAEKCCASAKERAKHKGSRDGDVIGNWVDFQICSSRLGGSLRELRENTYHTMDGRYLLKRPYYLPFPETAPEKWKILNDWKENKEASFDQFKENMKLLKKKDQKNNRNKPTKSDVAAIRNTYYKGEDAIEKLFQFLHSRHKLEGEAAFRADGKAQWYDETEMFELYEFMEE